MNTTNTKEEELKRFLIENEDKFYRLAYSYAKNREGALDIVQGAILNALKGIESLKNIEYLKTWFYRILINYAITYQKKNSRIIPMSDDVELIQEEQQDQAEILDLHRAVSKLEPKLKSVIQFRYFDDMKICDISYATNINESTIKSRLSTALRQLKAII